METEKIEIFETIVEKYMKDYKQLHQDSNFNGLENVLGLFGDFDDLPYNACRHLRTPEDFIVFGLAFRTTAIENYKKENKNLVFPPIGSLII